jgi:hypothetical protein
MTTLDLITREDLQKFKDELFAELRQLNITAGNASPAKKWMKSAEVREMLDISPGTLQNFRINGTLRFTKIGSLVFYKREDIEKILEDNLSANK